MQNFNKILSDVIYGDYWNYVSTGINVHKIKFDGAEIEVNETRETLRIIKPLGTSLVGFILTENYPVPILSGIGKILYIGSQKASKEMDEKLLKEIHKDILNLNIIQVHDELIVQDVLDDIYAEAMLNGLGDD